MSDLTEHTFLVAVVVRAETRAEAEELLSERLPVAQPPLDCWWVAEDDRRDGSDNESAVFVKPGTQKSARQVLEVVQLTGEPDYRWTWAQRVQAHRDMFKHGLRRS